MNGHTRACSLFSSPFSLGDAPNMQTMQRRKTHILPRPPSETRPALALALALRIRSTNRSIPLSSPTGTYVTQVTATDADDPTYGNSARVVYSILHGQPYFSVDPKTGWVPTRFSKRSYPLLSMIQSTPLSSQCLTFHLFTFIFTSSSF